MPSVRTPMRSACSRMLDGSRSSGVMIHSRCQLCRINGATKSFTNARHVSRIIFCSSDRPRSLVFIMFSSVVHIVKPAAAAPPALIEFYPQRPAGHSKDPPVKKLLFATPQDAEAAFYEAFMK